MWFSLPPVWEGHIQWDLYVDSLQGDSIENQSVLEAEGLGHQLIIKSVQIRL